MTDSTPVDVEALIARLGTMSWKGTRHRFDIGDYWNICEEAEEALRALAAELDKERLAGKNTANMMLDMATENKSLRAELAALKAQEPVAEPMTNGWIIHFDGWTNPETGTYLPPRHVGDPPRLFRTKEEAERHHSIMASHPSREHYSVRKVYVYTSPAVPPASANAVTKSHDELALLRRSISAQLLFLFDRNCRVVGNTLELPFDSHDHAFTQLMQARQLCEILSAQQETPR